MYTLQQLATAVGGEVAGDGAVEINGVGPFDHANRGDITMADGAGYTKRLKETRASAVIVGEDIECSAKPLLKTANPRLAFARVLSMFHASEFSPMGISELARVGEGCRLSARVSIHPYVSIGNGVEIAEEVTLYPGAVIGDRCSIGAGCVLYANVVLYPGVRLGKRVIIHGNTVIGADGFGYIFDGERQFKIPQTGNVEIHDEVEIGANSCIDCATFGSTMIERGAKIDNLVQIGHNCHIGENSIICGCVGISGSVTIGKNCILAGSVGVRDHVTIGDGAKVLARAGVDRDIPAGAIVSGFPPREHREELKLKALYGKLPQIYQDLARLRDQVAQLQARLDGDGPEH